MQKRDFSRIMVVSAAPMPHVWDTIGPEWQVLWVVRERTALEGGFFLFFCPISYTENYKAGTEIRQDKKMPWKAAGLLRHYLEYSILIRCICAGDRKENSLSDTQ